MEKIYKSGLINHCNTHDLNILLNILDINTYIDLRSSKELSKQGIPKFLERNINYIHCPIEANDSNFFDKINRTDYDYYLYYLKYIPLLKNALSYIINELNLGHNIVFGCFSVKDRTGVLSTILLKNLVLFHNFHL